MMHMKNAKNFIVSGEKQEDSLLQKLKGIGGTKLGVI